MASSRLFRTAITDDSSTAKEQLGILRKEYDSTNGFRVFKYVQASLTAAASNGICLSYYNTIGTVVTDDISTASANQPAGVATGTITNGNYAWIQVAGYHSAIDTGGEDGITDGMSLLLNPLRDGKCFGVAVGTAATTKILGVAVADDVNADDTVAGILCVNYGDTIQ